MQAVAEQSVRAFDRARPQLFDGTALRELREVDASEERGAEHRHVEGQVRVRVGALRGTAGETPPAFVPRTEGVAHLEYQFAVLRVRPAGQRRADVDEAHPQTVAHPVAHPPRLR